MATLLVIEDNEAHDSQIEHGIYVSNSGDRPIIRRNLIYDGNPPKETSLFGPQRDPVVAAWTHADPRSWRRLRGA